MPTLVVRGAQDRMVPQEWAEEVTRLLPAGRLAVVEKSGHMVPYRQAHSLVRLVTDFLAHTCAAAGAGGGTGPREQRPAP
ncbi:alpha/beta fold hydrolase [Streptomyces sp. NPDC001153]